MGRINLIKFGELSKGLVPKLRLCYMPPACLKVKWVHPVVWVNDEVPVPTEDVVSEWG